VADPGSAGLGRFCSGYPVKVFEFLKVLILSGGKENADGRLASKHLDWLVTDKTDEFAEMSFEIS